MTIGNETYQSIVNRWPILGNFIPDQYIRTIDSARMMMQYAADREREALACANKAIAAHNAGILTTADYRNYDDYRHKVYDTQVLWLQELRAALAQIPGGYVYGNRLPWPNWLKPLRPETPRNQTPMRLATPEAGVAGLGVLGVDDWIGVATVAIVVISLAVVAGILISTLGGGFQSWVVVHGQTAVISQSIEARVAALQQCIGSGGSASDCANAITHAVPAPSQAAIDQFVQQSTGKGFVYYMGVAALAASVIGIGWYGWRQGWFGKAKG